MARNGSFQIVNDSWSKPGYGPDRQLLLTANARRSYDFLVEARDRGDFANEPRESISARENAAHLESE